jgi:hypothetical protein
MNRGFVIEELFNPAVLITLGLVLLPLGIIALAILNTWTAPSNEEPPVAAQTVAQSFGSGTVVHGEHTGAGQAKVYDADIAQPATQTGGASPAPHP